MRRLVLTSETQAVLARLRGSEYPLCVYRRSAARVRLMVKDLINLRINRFGVALHELGMYNRYADEMLKAFRTRTREPLVHELEQAIRKWTNFGLNPNLLQLILCDCHLTFHNAGYQMKPKRRPGRKTKPGPKQSAKRRPTYKQMLRRHRVRLTGRSTIEEQSARHHAGTRHAKDIGFRLRGLLDARRMSTGQFVDYFAFAQALGSAARRYTARTLEMQAANLIDQWEAELLDRDTLVAIAVVIFDIPGFT
jgi:hypothetical protein